MRDVWRCEIISLTVPYVTNVLTVYERQCLFTYCSNELHRINLVFNRSHCRSFHLIYFSFFLNLWILLFVLVKCRPIIFVFVFFLVTETSLFRAPGGSASSSDYRRDARDAFVRLPIKRRLSLVSQPQRYVVVSRRLLRRTVSSCQWQVRHSSGFQPEASCYPSVSCSCQLSLLPSAETCHPLLWMNTQCIIIQSIQSIISAPRNTVLKAVGLLLWILPEFVSKSCIERVDLSDLSY